MNKRIQNTEEKKSEKSVVANQSGQSQPLPIVIGTEPLSSSMEVHKHPHHVAHKKRGAEYLLEFFMLFLAVFLGFLAENWREHLVDLRKEKEYMFSLVQDLKTDTATINRTAEFGTNIAGKLDSLVDMLNTSDINSNTQRLYSLVDASSRIVAASFEDRTSTQLKNSGNLRLVRNAKISDSIREYFSNVNLELTISARMEEIQMRAAEIRDQLFNNKYFEKRTPGNPFITNGQVSEDAKLIDDNPKLIAQLSNKCSSRLGVLYNYLNNLQQTKLRAERLISLINDDYHFE